MNEMTHVSISFYPSITVVTFTECLLCKGQKFKSFYIIFCNFPNGPMIAIINRIQWASLVAQLVKNPPAMQETLVRFLGQEDPLAKG